MLYQLYLKRDERTTSRKTVKTIKNYTNIQGQHRKSQENITFQNSILAFRQDINTMFCKRKKLHTEFYYDYYFRYSLQIYYQND